MSPLIVPKSLAASFTYGFLLEVAKTLLPSSDHEMLQTIPPENIYNVCLMIAYFLALNAQRSTVPFSSIMRIINYGFLMNLLDNLVLLTA